MREKAIFGLRETADFGDLLAHHTFDASPNAARPPGMPQIGGKIERPFSCARQIIECVAVTFLEQVRL